MFIKLFLHPSVHPRPSLRETSDGEVVQTSNYSQKSIVAVQLKQILFEKKRTNIKYKRSLILIKLLFHMNFVGKFLDFKSKGIIVHCLQRYNVS